MASSSERSVGSSQWNSSGIPSFDLCRNLRQLHCSFSRVGRGEKQECLEALPETIREKIYWHIWDLSGQPLERNYGGVHVLDSEDRLQKSIWRVASEVFKNLSSEAADRVLKKMKELQPSGCHQVFEASDIEIESTELFLDSLSQCSDGLKMGLPPFEEIARLTDLVGGPSGSGNFTLLGPSIFNQLFRFCRIMSSNPNFFKEFVAFVDQLDEVKKIGLEPGELQTISKSFLANDRFRMDESTKKLTFISYILQRAYSLTADREADCSLLIRITDFISSFSEDLMVSSRADCMVMVNMDQYISQLKKVLEFDPYLYLHRSLQDCRESAEEDSGGHSRYLGAIDYYKGLTSLMSILLGSFQGGHFNISEKLIPSKYIPTFINFQILNLKQQIEKDADCPVPLREALLKHTGRIHQRLSESTLDMDSYMERLLCSTSIIRYCSVFVDEFNAVSERCYRKRFTETERLKNVKILCNYARDHRKEFEHFIPRLQEVSTLISEASDQIRKDLFNLQNIPLFLKHGEKERVFDLLANAGNWQEQDAILYSEVSSCYSAQLTYNEQHELDPAKAKLQEGLNRYYRGLVQKWVEMPKSIVNIFDVWIRGESFHRPYLFQDAEVISNEYYKKVAAELGLPAIVPAEKTSSSSGSHPSLQPSSKASHSNRKHQKGKQKKIAQSRSSMKGAKPAQVQIDSRPEGIMKGELSESSVPSPSVSSSSSSFEASSVGSSSSSFSSSDLEQIRKLLRTYFSSMTAPHSQYAAASLKDAQEHFDQLLYSMRRLQMQSSSGKLTERALFAFVNDTIRHCSLGVEQLLSAVHQETNQIQSLDEVTPNLTHNLVHILQMSNLNKDDFSPNVRRWIREINGGEIILREPMSIRRENKLLQRLLAQSHQLVDAGSGSSSLESQDLAPLFKTLSEYLHPLGELLQSTSCYFPLKSGGSVGSSDELESQCSSFFSSFCDEMATKACLASPSNEPLLEELGELTTEIGNIRALLEKSSISQRIPGSFSESGSALHNQLLHLEQEVLSCCSLEPIETSLHLSNVLLLNQHIVETVLKNQILGAGISISFEEERQHDLIGLIQKLQIPEDKFTQQELEFLRTGKSTRQLVRYPAFYALKGNGKTPRLTEIKDLLARSRRLSSQQSVMQDLHGFTLAGNDAKYMQSIKALVTKDLKIMGAIIKKVLDS